MPFLTGEDAASIRRVLGAFTPKGMTDSDMVDPVYTLPVDQMIAERYPEAEFASGDALATIKVAAAYLVAAGIASGQRRIRSGSIGEFSMTFSDGQIETVTERWRSIADGMLRRLYPGASNGSTLMGGMHFGTARGGRG